MERARAIRGGGNRRRRAPLWGAATLLAAAALPAAPAAALQLGGSLAWDLARTETHSSYTDVTQESLGQTYRINASSALIRHELADVSMGAGFRRDFTNFAGTSDPNRRVTLTDLDLGLVLLPGTLPISLNFRRSMVHNSGDASASQSTRSSTVSLSTQLPMADGNPLALSAYQTSLDPGTGSATSRLVSLAKRFNLGDRNRLNTSYQFSQFEAPGSRSTGHGVSLADNTDWNPQLSSNVYANVSTRETTTTRLAEGRSLFLNNSAGGSLSYRRARDVSANLAYSYMESPQDQGSDIRSHLLSGHGDVRLDKKTDVTGRFTVRRLDLENTTLDTADMNVGLTYRPRFGWSTGGQAGVARNTTSGAASTSRNTFSTNLFFNARHELDPVQINWGGNVAYATTSGNFAQDRLTTSAQAEAVERRLRWIRLTSEYRFTDIRESQGGGLDPFTREHGFRITGTVVPVRGLWLPTDVVGGSATGGIHWSRQYQADRNVRTSDLTLEGRYSPFSGLTSSAAFEVHDNSSNLGGADEILRANVTWGRSVTRRSSMSLSGDLSRNYSSGNFQSQQLAGRFSYDYAVGLLRVVLSADYTTVDLGAAATGTDTNSVRLSILRTF